MTVSRKRRGAYLLLGLGLLGAVIVAAGMWFPTERMPVDLSAARETLLESEPIDSFAPEASAPPTSSSSSTSQAEPALDVLASEPVTDDVPVTPESGTSTTVDRPVRDVAAPTAVDDADRKGDRKVMLIVGSDAHETRDVTRADAIMLLVVDANRGALVSLPRSLYVESPCTEAPAPLNLNLEGCRGISGMEALGIAVEDYAGLTIDNFMVFGFDGFREIIDFIGGYEVCVENPVKLEATAPVFLEAGCTTLDGIDALHWVRARSALEQRGGQWRLLDGGGDVARTGPQRDVVRYVLDHIARMNDLDELFRLAVATSSMVTVDEGFNLSDAVNFAWDLRSSVNNLKTAEMTGTTSITPEGEIITKPTEPFPTTLDLLLG